MKKFLLSLCVVAVAGAIGTASAMDRSGKFALGFQETFTSGIQGATAANALGAWSVKYGLSSNLTGQFNVGFDMRNKSAGKRANFGARILYDLVENEMSDFYTGLGILYDADQTDVLRINLPLGFEWSFASLPEVALSAEAGIMVDFQTNGGKVMSFSSTGGNVGGALGLGAHYYF